MHRPLVQINGDLFPVYVDRVALLTRKAPRPAFQIDRLGMSNRCSEQRGDDDGCFQLPESLSDAGRAVGTLASPVTPLVSPTGYPGMSSWFSAQRRGWFWIIHSFSDHCVRVSHGKLPSMDYWMGLRERLGRAALLPAASRSRHPYSRQHPGPRGVEASRWRAQTNGSWCDRCFGTE